MKKRNGMLKKSVAFALALVMGLGQAPTTLLASEESVDTSLVPQVESSEVVEQSEEGSTENVDSEVTASLETDGGTTPEETNAEPVGEEPTEECSGEDSSATVTEVPTEQPEGDFTDGSETGTPDENIGVCDDTNVTDVAEATPTPEPTQAVEEVVQFDYEGTYNALKSSWNSDRDTSRDSMLRNLVNKTGLVKYKYGAGHSATYFAEKGISDVADALYITENPEYLDDTGLIAWALWFNGRKEASYWVADTGMKGIGESDYFQSVNYDQLLPGDVACSEDGVWAIYGGKLDGYDVWIGSYYTSENPELGVCCDNVYRKDFKYFYRFTGFTDALKDENEGTDVPEATPTEGAVEEVEPTEVPKEENKEEVEPTEAPKEEDGEDKGELSGVLSAETLDPEGNAVNVSFTGDELQDDYIGNASLSSDDADKELYDSLAEYVGGEFDTVLPLMLDVTDESGNEVSEVGTVKVDIDSSIDFTDTVLYHYENEEWVRVDYEVVDGGVEFVTSGFSPFFFIKETNNSDDANVEDTTTGDDTNKDDTPDVNNGLIVNMVNEGTDSVKTGDTHKIALKTSYANPNDEDTANVKVYMWDGSKLDENVPAEGIIIKNLVDNKLIYQVENNKDLSVEVEYKTDKDEDGNVTASYLEFNLNPGTSLDMELEFTVKNGYYDEKSLRFSIDSSRSSGEVADNDFSYVCNPIKWTGEFGWNSLVKKSNVDNVGFNEDSKFNKDINYTFSAVHSSFGSKGSIFTKSIDVTDSIVIPSSVDLKGLIVEKNDEGKPTGKILDADGNTVFEFVGLSEVTEVTLEDYSITYKGTVVADEGSDIRNLSGLGLNAYMTKLGVSDDYVSTGMEVITNSVEMVFNPTLDGVDTITLDAEKSIKFDKDYTGLSVEKSETSSGPYKYGDTISYNVKITNKSRKNTTVDYFDVLSDGLYFNEDQVSELKSKGCSVGHVDTLYSNGDFIEGDLLNYSCDYTIQNSSTVLLSGVSMLVGVYLPVSYSKEYITLNYSVDGDVKNVSGSEDLKIDGAELTGNYLKVVKRIIISDDVLVNSVINKINFSLENYSNNTGSAGVELIGVYNGLKDVDTSSGSDKTIVDIDDMYISKFGFGTQVDTSLKLKGRGGSWVSSNSENFFEMSSNKIIEYSTRSIPVLEADVYYSSGLSNAFYKDMDSAICYKGDSSTYFGDYTFSTECTLEDGTVSESNVDFTSTALLDSNLAEMEEEGFTGLPKSSEFLCKKVHIRLELNGISDKNKITLLKLGLQSRNGSGNGYIGITNVKIDFGDKVSDQINSISKNGIEVRSLSSLNISYSATVSFDSNGIVGNLCYVSSSKAGIVDSINSNAIKDNEKYHNNVSKELFIDKYSVHGTNSNVWFSPDTDDYYFIDVTNESPFTKKVDLIDYSPYAGNYVIQADGYKNKWYMFKDYVKDYDLSNFGKLHVTSVTSLKGDVKNLSTSSDSDNSGILNISLNMQPYSKVRVCVKADKASLSKDTVKLRNLYNSTGVISQIALNDWSYFMETISTAWQGGYGSSVNEPPTGDGGIKSVFYDNYSPYNTVIIKDTLIYDKVKVNVPYGNDIKQALVGYGTYDLSDDTNSKNNKLSGRLSANYIDNLPMPMAEDDNMVFTTVVALENTSPRYIDLSKSKLKIDVPTGYRFVGFVAPDSSKPLNGPGKFANLGGQIFTDIKNYCKYISSKNSSHLWKSIYGIAGTDVSCTSSWYYFSEYRNVTGKLGISKFSYEVKNGTVITEVKDDYQSYRDYTYNNGYCGGEVTCEFDTSSGKLMPGMSYMAIYPVFQKCNDFNYDVTHISSSGSIKTHWIISSDDYSGSWKESGEDYKYNYDDTNVYVSPRGTGRTKMYYTAPLGSSGGDLSFSNHIPYSNEYCNERDSSNIHEVSVNSNILLSSSGKSVGIQKLVVARNNYDDLMSGKGLLNCYEEDMRYLRKDDNETVTYLIAVAKDGYSKYKGDTITISDDIPKGLELIGIQEVDLDKYKEYIPDTYATCNVDYDDIVYGRVNNYSYRYVGSNPDKYSVKEYYLKVPGEIQGGKEYDSLKTKGELFGTYSEDNTDIKFKEVSGHFSIYSVTGSYDRAYGTNLRMSLRYDPTDDESKVTYLMYTCRVHSDFVEENQNVNNNVSASISGYKTFIIDELVTLPRYANPLIESVLFNIGKMNRGRGSRGDRKDSFFYSGAYSGNVWLNDYSKNGRKSNSSTAWSNVTSKVVNAKAASVKRLL